MARGLPAGLYPGGMSVPSPDLAIGGFTDEGPWVVDPDAMRWRRDVDHLRDDARAQVPRVDGDPPYPTSRPLRPRRRPGGLRSACGSSSTSERPRRAFAGRVSRLAGSRGPSGPARAPRAEYGLAGGCRAGIAFGHLGPTYIKLGQIISGGEGLFPPELVAEFKLLRDRVPRGAVRRSAARRRARPRPLARRRVRVVRTHADRGRVDRPGARGEAAHRAKRSSSRCSARRSRGSCAKTSKRWRGSRRISIGRIPVAALANPPALVELFAETIVEELDFRLEAQNMLDIARVLAETDQRATARAAAAPDARDARACS